MKKYKLLKDLPTFKAGEEFFISKSGNLIAGTPEKPKRVLIGDGDFITATEVDLMAYAKETLEQFPDILTDWFEEIEELEWIYFIDTFGGNVSRTLLDIITDSKKNMEAIGNYFETKEEAEKYAEYLKAKAIIKQDAKGFKPNWKDRNEYKFYGDWDTEDDKFYIDHTVSLKRTTIFFSSFKEIEESFKKHPEEWKIYLTYEQ